MQYKKYPLRGLIGLLLSSIMCVLLLNTSSTSRTTPMHRILVRLNTSDVDVNLARQGDAAWLYSVVNIGTPTIIY